MCVPDGGAGKPNRRARRRSKLKTQLDDVACERSHQNHDGLHGVVLFDLRRITPGRRPIAEEVRMRRRDIAAGVRDRAPCRHRRGALSVALRDLHCAGYRARSGLIEARNSADEVAMRAPSPESPRPTPGRPLGPPPDPHGGPMRLRCIAAKLQEEIALDLSVVIIVVCSRFISGNCTASYTRCIPRRLSRSRRRRARAVTRTTTVDTWWSSSTSPRSNGGPSRLGCTAAKSQEEIALDLSVVIIVVCSRFISGNCIASYARCIRRRVSRSEDGGREPSPEPPRSSPGRPLRPLPDPHG